MDDYKRNGVPAPNTTQVPNELFDVLLPEITMVSELKVILTVIRQTFGYSKDEDVISITQFEEKTGLTRQGVINGIAAAEDRGLIHRREVGNSYGYSLIVNVIDQQDSQQHRPKSQEDRHTTTTTDSERPSIARLWNDNVCLLNSLQYQAFDVYEERWGYEMCRNIVMHIAQVKTAEEMRNLPPSYFVTIAKAWEKEGRITPLENGRPNASAPDPLEGAGKSNQPSYDEYTPVIPSGFEDQIND